MADRQSAASRSRRIFSPPPAQSTLSGNQPGRSQRVIRSQSRDVSDSDMERKGKYSRKAKQGDATSSDGSTIPSKQRKGRPKQNDDTGVLQALPEVEENAQKDYPQLPQRDPDDIDQAFTGASTDRRRRGQAPKSPGGTSTFSGTTARISGSGQEFSVINAEDMTDALEELSHASNKILDLFIPQEVTEASIQRVKKQLSNLKSKETKQFQRYTPNFQAQREIYGGDRFIDVPATVRAILGVSKLDNVRPGPWRMDPILYQANLANLLMASVAQDGEDVERVTGELDKVFPSPFVQVLVDSTTVEDVANGSALLRQSFRIALEIRTRYFIDSAKRLLNQSGFDPDELLTQIFYKDESKLKGWNVAGLRSEDINSNKDFKTLIIDRLAQLRETFSETEDPSIDLGSLEEAFSQVRLTTAVTWWSQSRLQEIKVQMNNVEGAAGILRAIQSTANGDDRLPLGTMDQDLSRGKESRGVVLNYRQSSDSPHMKPNQTQISQARQIAIGSRTFKRDTFNSPKVRSIVVAHLKEKEADRKLPGGSATTRSAAPTRTAPTPVLSASVPPRTESTKEIRSATPPSYQAPPDMSDDGQLFITDRVDVRADAEHFLHTYTNLEAESNKENLPLQPRPQQHSNSESLPHKEGPPKKRHFLDAQPNAEQLTWDSQESEPRHARNSRLPKDSTLPTHTLTQDDDSNSDDAFQEDTREITRPQRSDSPSRPNRSDPNPKPSAKRRREGQDSQATTESIDLDNALETHNNANAPPLSQAETHQRVNAHAKLRTAMRGKRVQVRTPWSAEETGRLLDLIADYGLSWSYLKQMDKSHADGELLQRRDQVGLKDKARNLKMDYLKSEVPLPLNFHDIKIGRIQQETLAKFRIRYDPTTGDRENARIVDEASDDTE